MVVVFMPGSVLRFILEAALNITDITDEQFC
jgi:hypothetical protein